MGRESIIKVPGRDRFEYWWKGVEQTFEETNSGWVSEDRGRKAWSTARWARMELWVKQFESEKVVEEKRDGCGV